MTKAEYRARLKRRRCYVGMDLSSTKDLTAVVAVFPDEDKTYPAPTDDVIDRHLGFNVLAEFFVPEDSIRERTRRDKVPYDQWAREGYIRSTPGNVVDYEAVRRLLLDWSDEFDLREIAYDLWNATDLITRLEKQDGFTCVMMRQGFASLSAPTKSLEKAILSKRLRHDGHPVLSWNIRNVSVETDAAGNLKPSKDRSTERIDGVSALVMAVDRMDRNSAAVKPAFQMIFVGGR